MAYMTDKNRNMILRLIVSIVFVVPLTILSLTTPDQFVYYFIKLAFCVPIIAVNGRIFSAGFSHLVRRRANAYSLIAVAVAASILIVQIDIAGIILTLALISEFIDSRIALRTGETWDTLLHENEVLNASVSRFSEKADHIFVPAVLCVAAVTFLGWLLVGKDVMTGALAGISVLVVACPGTLELAAPAAFTVGLEKGVDNNILIRRTRAMEQAYKIDTVVLDKTGTITVGRPDVTDIIALDDDFDLFLAASIEKYSEHPLAKAICAAAAEQAGEIPEPRAFEEIPGRGVQAAIGRRTYVAGNQAFMEAKGIEPDFEDGNALALKGKIVVYFAAIERESPAGGELVGVIALRDGPRPTSLRAVTMLENMGIDVIMLTGDNYATSEAIRKEVGIDRAIAQVLPHDKDKVIANIQDDGRKLVAMVGDGVSDAEAIARADVGISFGNGPADISLLRNDLTDVARSITLSRAVMTNIKQNLLWALCYNAVGVLLAIGALIPLTGWMPGPVIATGLMCLSPLVIIANSLRLRRLKLYQK